MVEALISFSIKNRILVLLVSAGLFGWGIYSVQQNPIDAIPDLSENQVIVFTEWMGRSPQVIEDQVTYPLVSNLQGIPKVKNIRGSSMFGMSFVYIIFEDNVDVYWARTRVLERLNYAQRLLPQNVVPTLGPDGTGVGHIFWYHLEANGMDLGEQRALQDWYVKFALQTVPGVAEVASFGGFEKQYQLVLDPLKMQYYDVSMMEVMNGVRTSNNDVGGRKFEMSDMAHKFKHQVDIGLFKISVFFWIHQLSYRKGVIGSRITLRIWKFIIRLIVQGFFKTYRRADGYFFYELSNHQSGFITTIVSHDFYLLLMYICSVKTISGKSCHPEMAV